MFAWLITHVLAYNGRGGGNSYNNDNITTLFRYQAYLAGHCMPANWGHHLFNTLRWTETFHVTETHTHINTDMSLRVYSLTSLSKRTQKSKHLQILRAWVLVRPGIELKPPAWSDWHQYIPTRLTRWNCTV